MEAPKIRGQKICQNPAATAMNSEIRASRLASVGCSFIFCESYRSDLSALPHGSSQVPMIHQSRVLRPLNFLLILWDHNNLSLSVVPFCSPLVFSFYWNNFIFLNKHMTNVSSFYYSWFLML